jgi:phosphonate transport system substrate-binding protein
MLRRRACKLALAAAASWALFACDGSPYREVNLDAKAEARPARAAPVPGKTLRVSVAAMLSPRDTYTSYSRLFERVGQRLGVEVEFVQRRTYAEVNELLLAGRVDVAFLCTGGYLELRDRAPSKIEVAAVPLRDGKATYQSLIIVPASSGAKALGDLAGRKFAFTDELSFSGYAYAAKLLRDIGEEPRHFFGTVTFTRSHDRSVNAVAQHLMDGAAVDSLIYEDMVRRDPGLASATRIVHRSTPFGTMPVVVSTRLPPETRARIRAVLLGLDRDPETAETLHVLHIDRFALPPPGLYDTAAVVVEARR